MNRHHLLVNSLSSDEHVNVTILNITKNTPLRLRQKCRARYLQYPVIIIFRLTRIPRKFQLEFLWSCDGHLMLISLPTAFVKLRELLGKWDYEDEDKVVTLGK